MRHLISALVLVQLMSVVFCEDSLERFKRASRVKRIIGGADILEGDWPWLVHLTGKIPSRKFWGMTVAYKNFYCGGSIINKRWILTAAHCFKPTSENSLVTSRIVLAKHWHVKAGEVERKHSWFDRFKSTLGDWFRVSRWQMYYEHALEIHIHPDYDNNPESLWPNDLALVKLSEDLPIGEANRYVEVIDLPRSVGDDWPTPGSNCTIKGWGCTAKGGSLPNVAKAVVLPVRTPAICNSYYGEIRHADKRLCAGPEFKSKGICPGDSGGPLVCKEYATGRWIQAGIASFTSASQPQNIPSVYTRLTEYITWINDVMA